MVRVNVNGCLNMLEYARASGAPRFVLSRQHSAYEWYPATKFNPPDSMPVREDHPCRPRDMYSSTKRMQELLAMTFFHQYHLPATVLRLTAVVGPGGAGAAAVGASSRPNSPRARASRSLDFSAGELCHYVDYRDVAAMHLAAAQEPGAVGEIFNCCGPAPTRGSEFAAAVQALAPGIKVEYGFPWSMAQGGEIAFDMSKAKRLLGFAPRYSLADSVRSIKDWIDGGGLTEAAAGRETFGSGMKA